MKSAEARRRVAALAAAATLLFPAIGPAAEGAAPKKSGDEQTEIQNEAVDKAEPKLSVTEHTVTIGGEPVKYAATAGYLILNEETDGKGKAKKVGDGEKQGTKPTARIFFVAYTRETSDVTKRPLTFSFNGGPGSASVWLHLGALGPRRVRFTERGEGLPPPYQLADNAFSWLDDTDLVFIDPVSTGYSRPAPGESAKPFHGFEGDIKSVAEFIRLYTSRNGRWLSPKFVTGESYGGTRAAALSQYLQEQTGLYLNGVMLVSGLLNWQTIDFSPGNDLAYVLYLPSYAAAAWYHKRLAPDLQQKPVENVRREAEAFALKDYTLALLQGDKLPDGERRRVASQLARLTGLPAAAILHWRLRIPSWFYRDELLKAENRTVGRFDSRFKGIAHERAGDSSDPSFEAVRGAFTAAINAYLRDELKFESDLTYETVADVGPWDFSNVENRYLNVTDSLGKAMSRNPYLKAWFAAGYYDLAIPYFATDYAVSQMNLDPAVRNNLRLTAYEAGHMLYTDEASLQKFKADFESFLRDALDQKPVNNAARD